MLPILKAGALALLFAVGGTSVRPQVEARLQSSPYREEILQTINCESGFDPSAVGDQGNSYGLVQINLPSHPHVTKTQALNWEFALTFIEEEFRKGNQNLWTCYRINHNG